MRWVFAAWAVPMGLFWGWYFLSFNDMSFGVTMLSRPFHDMFFRIYGDLLGIDPATIPPIVARACILDTFIILGIWALRRRKAIADRLRTRRERYSGAAASPSA